MKLRFAADADFNDRIIGGLKRRVSGVDVVRLREVGRAADPDPDVLEWAAAAGRIVLTHDRKTMPRYAVERLDRGLPLAGVVVVPQRLSIGAAIEDLEILIAAGAPEDFQGRVWYLPL